MDVLIESSLCPLMLRSCFLELPIKLVAVLYHPRNQQIERKRLLSFVHGPVTKLDCLICSIAYKYYLATLSGTNDGLMLEVSHKTLG